MIRLAKKKEAAAAAATEAAIEANQSSSSSTTSIKADNSKQDNINITTTTNNNDNSSVNNDATNVNSVNLFGIAGKKVKQDGDNKKPTKKRTPGEIRIQKDIAELDGGSVARVNFPNPNDLTHFEVIVTPDSGFWCGATYQFTIAIPPLYPHEAPKVTCRTKVYHPNINLQGNVCLNILREDWKPVLDINAVIYGMIYLFYEPNPDDPLNREASDLYRTDKVQFGKVVKRTLQGYSHAGETFEKLI